MARTAVVYLHAEHEAAFLLGDALRAEGFSLEERRRRVLSQDTEADLVVAMGGPMAVYEASKHPFLWDELRVLRARLLSGRPCVGICLGAQLLAGAAGARVFRGPTLEIGAHPVTLTETGKNDPVLGATAGLPVAHWHGDTFTPPPGATLLASTDAYAQQAFVLGASYGLQFHPELSAATYADWAQDLSGAEREKALMEAPRLVASRPGWDAALGRLARAMADKVRP